MSPFFIWLVEAVGVGLIAVMQIERYQPEDPVLRYAIITFGALLFGAALFYQIVARARGVMRIAPQVRGAIQQAVKRRPQDVKKWKRDFAKHPWKNFVWSFVYTIVALGFLSFGIFVKVGWASPVARVIEIIVAGILTLLGFWTMVNYVWIIVRGKR